MRKIQVGDKEVRVTRVYDKDYICLTDFCKGEEGRADTYLSSYLKRADTLEFLTIWETMSNPDFKTMQAHGFKLQATLNRSAPSVSKWMDATNALGFHVEKGRYGGTYAHDEIAIHFVNWFRAEYYVYFIKAFKEISMKNLSWHISKITDNIDEVRNLLDTIPGQDPKLNRLKDE